MSILETFAPAWYDRRTDAIIRGREDRAQRDLRAELRWRWRAACERPSLQLAHVVSTPLGGMGPGRAPRIVEIILGDDWIPTTFVVELSPGQILEDLEDAGPELASALGVHRLAFDRMGTAPYVAVTMIEADPHANVVEAADVASLAGAITLGPDEYGHPIRLPFGDLTHVAVQGSSGAGKSVSLYWIMQQIVGQPGTRLAGVDPSGVIFRPLGDDPWRVSGLGNPHRVVEVLGQLVDEMDARCARMPWDDDKLPCGLGRDPWLFVVLEELPGLLSALTAVDRKAAELARLYISRLTAEGRKAGVRCILAAQRFEANSTAGATVRSNCGLRVSFRVENATAVQFLHDDATADQVAEHVRAAAGVALVSAPGRPVRRTRFPAISYREWAHHARGVYGVPAAGWGVAA